uniref:Epidermal retinol dehydrogenase 2-like n=1 Tax=Crassostrea virginica TaxID=6565 RepID=A0A8B8F304_CRAVI|nr:epidermal retinol dehydrogenase 2-like [Crassostrea virginica]
MEARSPPPTPNQSKDGGVIGELLQTLRLFFSAIFVGIWRFFVPPPKKSVFGEVVLITGAGSGIGRQLAREFARLGSVVVLWDINKTSNTETAKLLQEEFQAKCFCYTVDVGDKSQIQSTAARVKTEVGEVNILINNAGVVSGKKLLDTPDVLVQRTFDVNLLAHFWTVKCFLPSMLKNNHGHIVNISSSTGLVGLNKLTDYSASKFGVVGFTEVLNYEIIFSGYKGVHTTLVCSSYVKTGMFAGCKMRYPWLLPALEVKNTTNRIMQGILTNQYVICIPRLVYFLAYLKVVLPVDAFLEVVKFFGAASFMDTYVGKETNSLIHQNGSS